MSSNNNTDLYDFASTIKTYSDFIFFLGLLQTDYNSNKKDWQNNTLDSYIEALKSFSMDTIDDNNTPSWNNFAQLLLGAIVYE